MKRIIFAFFALLLLIGCGEQPEQLYSHVVKDDYISDTYYLTEIEPRSPEGDEMADYGVFERAEPGAFRLLLNVGPFSDIYPARLVTLVRGHILYRVDGRDIASYNLKAKEPRKTETKIEDFFPEELDVIGINALNDLYVYVYAQLNAPIPHQTYSLSGSGFKSYTAYFAIRVDGGDFKEVLLDDIPVQKRQ